VACNNMHTQKARDSAASGPPSSTRKTRTSMNWNVRGVKMCKKSAAFCYGFAQDKFVRAAAKFKPESLDQMPLFKQHDFDDDSYFGDLHWQDIADIFDDNDVGGERKYLQASLVRRSNRFLIAFIWMEDYFSLSESQPNSTQVHLDLDQKRRIWRQYKQVTQEKYGCHVELLSESHFNTLWSSAFGFVKIRERKRVSGKCATCAHINKMKRETKDYKTLEALKHLMIMHRGGFFMLERLEYKRRIHDAVFRNPGTTMSSIIDGASSEHVILPHLGPSQQLRPGFEQHIQGVLTHGQGFTLYRTFPHVRKCADLVIFCLFKELEEWANAHNGKYPEVWYIQVDGGSENANKTLLAALEFLIIKRIVRKIVLTRLPVGHTHEVLLRY